MRPKVGQKQPSNSTMICCAGAKTRPRDLSALRSDAGDREKERGPGVVLGWRRQVARQDHPAGAAPSRGGGVRRSNPFIWPQSQWQLVHCSLQSSETHPFIIQMPC